MNIELYEDEMRADQPGVEPLHDVDPDRVRRLADSMRAAGGWQGPPVLLAVWDGAEVLRRVLDGHHRIEAAKLLWREDLDWAWEHLEVIPAICVDGDALDEATGGEWPTRLGELDELIGYHERS